MKHPYAYILIIFAVILGGCADFQPPPIATPPASVSSSAQCRKQNGKEITILINLPPSNPAAQRYPEVYKKHYVEGYMSEWNNKVMTRQVLYRAYGGKFKGANDEKNFGIYAGETFDLERVNQQAQGATNMSDRYAGKKDAFALSDETLAGRTGREDGQLAARQDFATQLLPLEK